MTLFEKKKIEWGLKLLIRTWEYKEILCCKKQNKQASRKLTCDIVLLTKVQILFKFHKTLCSCPLFAFILYSRFHIVFSCIEQLQLHASNSGKFSFTAVSPCWSSFPSPLLRLLQEFPQLTLLSPGSASFSGAPQEPFSSHVLLCKPERDDS